jgi:exopolyphosphatase/guanosine-5'-triphosphate,3'-diphosphate pyrophosphatase
MRVAAIDIGTNSVLLTVAKLLTDRKLKPVYGAQAVTRLGRDTDRTKRISKQSMNRTLRAVKKFRDVALRHGAEKIWATGTSALREAVNREEFTSRAKNETGLTIEIVSGKTEAVLTFKGALQDLEVDSPTIALIDIGGGSTEVSLVINGRLRKSTSLNLGSVRLTEQFFPQNIINPDRIGNLEDFLEVNWNSLKNWKFENSVLVGTAGTITTLAALDLKLNSYHYEKIHGHILTLAKIRHLYQKLSSMNLPLRRKLLKIEPKRADVIVAGCSILLSFMPFFKFDRIVVSDRSLRWGLIRHKLGLN